MSAPAFKRISFKTFREGGQSATVVDPNNFSGHGDIPGVQSIPMPWNPITWYLGHFSAGFYDVHGNILRDPSGWAPQVKWR